MKPKLLLESLLQEAAVFAEMISDQDLPSLFGVTDGKAVGTYLEHRFQSYLEEKYDYQAGSSAKGVDFPGLDVDMKVTSYRQPQSSSPYESARQKIRGLGYSLLVFVYEKEDNDAARTSKLNIVHTVFIDKSRTGDYRTTRGIREIIEKDGSTEDLVEFIKDRNLPVEESEAEEIADEVLRKPPKQGFLTISNALQWRLQYGRVIDEAGRVDGVTRVSLLDSLNEKPKQD